MKTTRMWVGIVCIVLLGVAVFFVSKKEALAPTHSACTTDAKICPDGSSVGRTGPECAFSTCPIPQTNQTQEVDTTSASLSQKIFHRGVHITPHEVVEDSRCPVDVTCIQAGTVKVRVSLESEAGAQMLTLTLGTPVLFAGKRVSLTSVTPIKYATKTITPSQYRFVFSVSPGATVQEGVLHGVITLGPVCPVVQVDNPCIPTPEMYAAQKVAIYASDTRTLITTATPDAQGMFSVALIAGKYYVDMVTKIEGIGSARGVPTTVSIQSGETTKVSIDIDTGIR